MHDDLMAAVQRLYHQIHSDDQPPQSEREHQAAFVLEHMRSTVLGLIMEGVTPPTLELTLFYQWLRLSTLNRNLSDEQFNDLAANMGEVMRPLVQLLQGLEPTLVDEGPIPAMQKMGGMIQELKDAFSALGAQSLSHDDVVRHTDLSNRAAFGLVQACLDAEVHPGLIESVFLYYWLRASTINANVPESFFQKLERHWEVVVERVGGFVDQLARDAQR